MRKPAPVRCPYCKTNVSRNWSADNSLYGDPLIDHVGDYDCPVPCVCGHAFAEHAAIKAKCAMCSRCSGFKPDLVPKDVREQLDMLDVFNASVRKNFGGRQ